MKGIILTHSHELLKVIAHTKEMMQLRTRTMNNHDLHIRQRARAGQEFLQLVEELVSYEEELDDILENYFGESLTQELHALFGL